MLQAQYVVKGGNMSNGLCNAPADAGDVTFAPAHHLLGIVQRIVASGSNSRIALPGKGEVFIIPGRNEYHADVQDMAEFCRTPSAHFNVTGISGDTQLFTSSTARNIKELLWQAAFHASQGRLLDGCTKYDVVKFNHWPNLTRLPVTPNAARICALLTRHPTTIMLVHRVLGIDKEEVCHIYSAAYSAGIAHIAHSMGRTPEVAAGLARLEATVDAEKSEPTHERGLFRSLFAKISGL